MAPIVIPTTETPAILSPTLQEWFLIGVAIYLAVVLLLLIVIQCCKPSCSEEREKCEKAVSVICCSLPCLSALGDWTEKNIIAAVRNNLRQSQAQPKGLNCNCGGPGSPNDCCECFIACAQACDCNVPDLRSCCDSICGPRKRCDFADCLACECCGGPQWPGLWRTGHHWCPCCWSEGQHTCPKFSCPKPDCTHINCCCCVIAITSQ